MGLCDHTATVHLGGKDIEVRLNFAVVREFERAYGQPIAQFGAGGTSVDGYTKLAALSIKAASGKKVTEVQLDRWFSAEPGAFGQVVEALQGLILQFWKESHGATEDPDEEESSDPPVPAAAGSTGTA